MPTPGGVGICIRLGDFVPLNESLIALQSCRKTAYVRRIAEG
jgi:hypothetical protein